MSAKRSRRPKAPKASRPPPARTGTPGKPKRRPARTVNLGATPGGGRACLCTPDRVARIYRAVRAGAYRKHAAEYGGVGYSTMLGWLRAGEEDRAKGDGGTRFAQFVAGLADAEADAVVEDLELIGRAAKESWQAAAWRLERRFPHLYGRRSLDVTVRPQEARKLLADALGIAESDLPADDEPAA